MAKVTCRNRDDIVTPVNNFLINFFPPTLSQTHTCGSTYPGCLWKASKVSSQEQVVGRAVMCAQLMCAYMMCMSSCECLQMLGRNMNITICRQMAERADRRSRKWPWWIHRPPRNTANRINEKWWRWRTRSPFNQGDARFHSKEQRLCKQLRVHHYKYTTALFKAPKYFSSVGLSNEINMWTLKKRFWMSCSLLVRMCTVLSSPHHFSVKLQSYFHWKWTRIDAAALVDTLLLLCACRSFFGGVFSEKTQMPWQGVKDTSVH